MKKVVNYTRQICSEINCYVESPIHSSGKCRDHRKVKCKFPWCETKSNRTYCAKHAQIKDKEAYLIKMSTGKLPYIYGGKFRNCN